MLVDRGWIAQGASRTDLPAAPPPSGMVTVHGRVNLPPQRYLELDAGSPWAKIARAHLEVVETHGEGSE